MSAVQVALSTLVDLLSSAVDPEKVRLEEDNSEDPAPIAVRILSLDRIGRSRRDGPVLDLDLAVAVLSTGPRRLDNLEQLITAVERGSRYSTGPLERTDQIPSTPGIGFLVHVPVSLRLDEPQGPPVREPLQIKTSVGRHLTGVVVGPGGKGLGGAYVRTGTSGPAVACDPLGRFQMLSTPDLLQQFTVEFNEISRQFTANAETLPVTLRWD
ncbi:hypothetical protein [Paenarthrobacter sp. PH39-S1]|uniref:hypothetical protein n=1 Tax=Paenarthrobacter sp. PH39-S1 TaxID=3046204 RepID=UPI0024BB41AF|nr:hypothetical protein [Paenarthrobacter sp. PH39-S1]MDJ0355992.1 hypothetical protein [Paenarthrobacter sp. PH39-S1]